MAALDRYLESPTGLEGEIWSGRLFRARFMCDDPTVGASIAIYSTKPPVCHLILTPRVQTLASATAWDISPSGSATSTISTYTIDFGGGGVANITGAAWAGAKTGTVTYNAIGSYTVEAFVTDLLGTTSQHCVSTVEIVLPEERTYIGTTDLGVFIMIAGATPVASNTGLTGDQLKLRALRVHPAYADLPGSQQHVWIATKAGVSYSTDGAATWTNITEATLGTPVNTAADSPAPTAADLDNIDIAFCPQDSRRVYLLRTWASPKRAWLYKSDDYGASWSNTQIFV